MYQKLADRMEQYAVQEYDALDTQRISAVRESQRQSYLEELVHSRVFEQNEGIQRWQHD